MPTIKVSDHTLQLIRGQAREGHTFACTATRSADGRWQVAGLTLDGPQHAGDKLEFAIRPEDLTIAPGGLKATARVIEPLGAHTLVTSEVNGALFRAVLDSDLKVSPGDELSLVPKTDRIRWFDPTTSNAVREST